MRLGLNLGYATGADLVQGVELAVEAERLGYQVCWAAEAYGSDAVTVLSYVAARTTALGVGAAVLQIPARTPAMTAMTAASLDTLSAGRFHLGLGVSGPQVSEGWHGVRFDKPLARTREYVSIVRDALARRDVSAPGPHYPLPLPDGPGKALRLSLHPLRTDIPLYLAAVGPKNLELAGEIADGWLAIFFSPEHAELSLAAVRAGRERAGTPGLDGFDVVASTPVVIGDDPVAAADPLRPYVALYVGGMGSRKQNFYNALARRMGFEQAADQVQELYLAGRPRDAAAAVPAELIAATSLIGPVPAVRDRLQALAQTGVGTVAVTPHARTQEERVHMLRQTAQAFEAAGVGA